MDLKVYMLLYTNLFFIHYSNAFNITTILSQFPSFSTFNHYLSETNLASEINSHKPVTVFAIPNDAITCLSGKSHDVLRNLLRVHVALEYYDIDKLRKLPNRTCQMTTLFQATGQAHGLQGFLKATIFKNGSVFIGSATQGSPLGAIVVRSIACETCNLSVVHISTVIVPVRTTVCPVPAPGSDLNPPIEPPARSPNMPLVPLLSPTQDYSPEMSPPSASSPKSVLSPAPEPTTKTPPTRSPIGEPEDSTESPPKLADAPPQSAGKDKSGGTSNFVIGLDFLITIVLSSSIYLSVQT
uniref:fasciclin-like arabinogalactan protein 14 n=1 Tax=Erigeron canadensis TaxID=72917 RepID=UPI001CB89CE4|nr:fasciclin-like arabinogalactan protein 14 [Erigeron canadensis]